MERIWQNLWKRKKKKFSRESEAQEVEDKENDSPAGRGEGEVERIIIKTSGKLLWLTMSETSLETHPLLLSQIMGL